MLIQNRRAPAWDLPLVSGRRGDFGADLPPNERRKLAGVGIIQMIPVVAGGMVSVAADSAGYAVFSAVAAVLLAGLIGWCLLSHIPPTRIEVRGPRKP